MSSEKRAQLLELKIQIVIQLFKKLEIIRELIVSKIRLISVC